MEQEQLFGRFLACGAKEMIMDGWVRGIWLTAIAVSMSVGGAVVAVGAKTDKTDKKPTGPKPAAVTYAKDIAPIIQKNCLTCHRAGEVAPFALENYKQAAAKAQMLKLVTTKRSMPPWKAESHGEFLDERRLSDGEIATIAKWADSGAQEGDKKVTPPNPKFRSGWKIGEPDAIFGMQETYQVGPEGRDEYHCFVIPTNYTEDKWVSAVEVHPGNRAIVHHVIAYIDQNGKARKLDEADPGPGYVNPTPGAGPGFFPTAFFGGWAPGNDSRMLPPGIGNLLPKGADLVLEVHYHRDGKPELDKTEIGLTFCKGPVEKRLRMMPVANLGIKIPAGEADHVEKAQMPISQDITVLAVTPHMHMLGKSARMSATLPDKSTRPLVYLPGWDFNWQLNYMFKQPVKLAKGSQVNLEVHYDNSDKNPKNPSRPSRNVTWGEQTTDEMCIGFVAYIADNESLSKGISTPDLYDISPGGLRASGLGGRPQRKTGSN